MKRNKAFTLIELVSVLVILAILALIVTTLVLNIIKKARIAADKRSIDAYGRSIELAVADYLLENGAFPTSIEELTIEYSGDRVVCSTTQLNSDSSVYLADCTVGNRAVAGYIYGKEEVITYKAYEIGDEVTYNNVNYYVIANSDATESSVTLLKAEPLTVEEVNTYGGVGTESNHVNMYATTDTDSSYYRSASDVNSSGYGGMQYYSSDTCTNYGIFNDCKNSYDVSEIKYVVDAWANDKVNVSDLQIDSLGYKARLLAATDFENLGLEYKNITPSDLGYEKSNENQSFLFVQSFYYWTMIPADDNNSVVSVSVGSYTYNDKVYDLRSYNYYRGGGGVRPVITIKKSALN